jgi:ATP-dependent Clp protease ATP-binding subunit ClpX
VLTEDLVDFGLIPEIIGRLRTPWAWVVSSDSEETLVAQYRKLVRFHGADVTFTKGAVRKIAKVALERRTGARGLRSVVEEVLEGVLFEVEAGVRYVITEKSVRGGEPLKPRLTDTTTPWVRICGVGLAPEHRA